MQIRAGGTIPTAFVAVAGEAGPLPMIELISQDDRLGGIRDGVSDVLGLGRGPRDPEVPVSLRGSMVGRKIDKQVDEGIKP
jgi:hypothetical protein